MFHFESPGISFIINISCLSKSYFFKRFNKWECFIS